MRDRIIRGIMSMGMSTLVRMVFGFASVTIAARVIPEEDFGVYFLLLTMAYLFEVLGDVGLRLSAARFVAGAASDDERTAFVNNIVTFRLLSVGGVALVAFAVRPLLLQLYSAPLLASLFFYGPILYAVQLTEETLSYLMQGFYLYRKMAFLQTLAGALNLALVWLFLLVMHLGIEGLILSSVVSLAITAAIRYLMIPTPKRLAFDRQIIGRIIRFGLPLQGNDILTFAFQRVDVLILGALMNPAYVAYLELAGKIPGYFQRLYYAINAVYFPQMSELFAQERRAKAEEMLGNFLRLVSFGMVLAALVFTLFQGEVMALIFSERYLPGAPALGLSMIALSIATASTILDTTLIAAGYPAYLLIINVITTVASVASNALLIPDFGFMGAVYAKLIANSVANPVSVYCLHREKIHAPLMAYAKPFLLLALCVGLYVVLGWASIAARIALLGVFLALSVAFSVITPGDLSALSGSLRLPSRQSAWQR